MTTPWLIHDIDVNLLRLIHLLGGDDGEEAPPKMAPEELARQEANAARLLELAERGLAELGMTREELDVKVGFVDPHRRTA